MAIDQRNRRNNPRTGVTRDDQRRSAAYRAQARRVGGDPHAAATGYHESMRQGGISAYDDIVGAYEDRTEGIVGSIPAVEASIQTGVSAAAAEGIGGLRGARGAGAASAMAGIGMQANIAAEKEKQNLRKAAAQSKIEEKQAALEGIEGKRKMSSIEEELSKDVNEAEMNILEAIHSSPTTMWGGKDKDYITDMVALQLRGTSNPQAKQKIRDFARSKGYGV